MNALVRAPGRAAVSLGALIGVVVVVPAALVWAARQRFGGAAPWTGVLGPSRWRVGEIADTLTERLTESTLIDIVIRVSLVIVWAALVVIVLTVVAEVVHMIRHDGLAMPSIRGLGWSQRTARFIAAGLLVVAPLSVGGRAAARSGGLPARVPAVSALVPVAFPADAPTPVTMRAATAAAAVPATEVALESSYVVQPGDSVYAIAERLSGGGGGARTVALANEILDLNLGSTMHDGQVFTNAAFIEVGWVLRLPTAPPADAASAESTLAARTYVVEPGDSLSAIADAALGDESRWDEIWWANQGDDMGAGRTFDSPDLILPGWELELPSTAPPAPADPVADPPAVAEAAAPAAVVPETSAPAVPATSSPAAPATPTTLPTTTAEAPAAATLPERTEAPAPVTSPATGPAPTAPVTTVTTGSSVPPATSVAPPGASTDGSTEPTARLGGPTSPVGLGGAAMVSAGLLALLGVRRRHRLRAATPRARVPAPRPGPAETERLLRSVDAGERLLRVDMAIRVAAAPLAQRDERVAAALVANDGDIELILCGPCDLPSPFVGAGDRWQLAGSIPVEMLAPGARAVGAPCVALVQLGIATDGRELLVDLEALGVLAVDATPVAADAVVAGVATTLGSSVFAEVAHLIGVGVDPAAFVGHRHHTACESLDQAVELAAALVGTTATASESTFALRTRQTGGEAWEPAVILVASSNSAEFDEVGAVVGEHGLAMAVAGAHERAPFSLVQQSTGWRFEPFGIELVPVGLDADDVAAISELVDQVELPFVEESTVELDTALDDLGPSAPYEEPAWSILVRLLGPVDVVDGDLVPAEFERSKTRELIAWLSTHRQRSSRTAARTALWELDVRDATFANVVSEARRAMARLVEPPVGEEWLGRTMTEQLPLHAAVRTDAELVEARLAAARLEPPDQAIATLRPAVEAIRGMPFEGTSYLWPDAEGISSSLVLLATSAAVELAAHHLSLGDVEGVFWATGQGLRVLPGHEELISLRMRAHGAAGDHAGVRHEWESYERVINADPWSDGEPAPKLVALRRELLGSSAGT